MHVVFKTMHYIDGAETKIIAVCKTRRQAKNLAEEFNAEWKYVPYYG